MRKKFGEVRKTVAFNLDRDDERKIYEFISETNFTQLVKRLLLNEVNRKKEEKVNG